MSPDSLLKLNKNSSASPRNWRSKMGMTCDIYSSCTFQMLVRQEDHVQHVRNEIIRRSNMGAKRTVMSVKMWPMNQVQRSFTCGNTLCHIIKLRNIYSSDNVRGLMKEHRFPLQPIQIPHQFLLGCERKTCVSQLRNVNTGKLLHLIFERQSGESWLTFDLKCCGNEGYVSWTITMIFLWDSQDCKRSI